MTRKPRRLLTHYAIAIGPVRHDFARCSDADSGPQRDRLPVGSRQVSRSPIHVVALDGKRAKRGIDPTEGLILPAALLTELPVPP